MIDVLFDDGHGFPGIDHGHRQPEAFVDSLHLGEISDFSRPADVGDRRQEGVLIEGAEQDIRAEQKRLFRRQGQKLLFPERLRRIFDLETGGDPLDGPPSPLRIEDIEDPVVEMDLLIVSGLPQLYGRRQGGLGRGRLFGDFSTENFSPQGLEARMAGVHEDQPGGSEQPGHPSGESLDQRPAGPIGFGQMVDDVRFELGIPGEILELPETIRDVRRQDDIRSRDLGFAGRHRAAEVFQPMILIQEDDMIDLGQIVIVRGQPKDRHEASEASPVEVVGEFDRGQGLIDRVERPGKQSDLLSGDDGASLLLGDFLDIAERPRSAAVALILPGQNFGQGFPRQKTGGRSLRLTGESGRSRKSPL